MLNYFSKPSEHGSLVALHMALLSQEAGFPPGLVNAPLLDSFTFDSLIAKLSDSFGFGSGLVWKLKDSSRKRPVLEFIGLDIKLSKIKHRQVSVLPGKAMTGKLLLKANGVACVTFSGSIGGQIHTPAAL